MSTPAPVSKGLPIVGIVLLTLALLKFVQGGDWVVWLILGVLFGGLGVFSRKGRAG
ncbi:hypothetical protein V5740_03695 [Croceibacterium sp. TMG7-5b_MA50]|uniref:hypothetical protein n=1 Tax=Croceibacterium sp. TMG7-5b_MA50 TaxID=3121290 RepID=UPI0032217DC3